MQIIFSDWNHEVRGGGGGGAYSGVIGSLAAVG